MNRHPGISPLLILTHADCAAHETGSGHPEVPARLMAVLDAIKTCTPHFDLIVREAPKAERQAVLRVHDPAYVDSIEASIPGHGIAWLDSDTAISSSSGPAIWRAAGSVTEATKQVLQGDFQRAFCAVRPPGHHAEPGRAMGFCFFNNIAIGVASALSDGCERVAIVDFDVHHGNGTEAIFAGDERVLFCSLFQYPLFPDSGLTPPANGVFVPLAPGTSGKAYRAAFEHEIIPALKSFSPEIIFVSAGFDAHVADPLAELCLVTDDFLWLTRKIVDIAERHGSGRVISSLEGGYDPDTLRDSVRAHLFALSGAEDLAASKETNFSETLAESFGASEPYTMDRGERLIP